MEESGEEESVGPPPLGGGSSSENGTLIPRLERLKLDEKPDRISDLPVSLIHSILSLLPSTEQAIRTGILSKRWKNQWTRVPVLIFDSTGMSNTNFSQFIDTTLTLHDCSKLKKFHIKYFCNLHDPHLTSKIRFATEKNVEELMLHLNPYDENGQILYTLPEFLFDNDSLVKLELFRCFIGDNQSTNWSSLKELKLECSLVSNLAIGNVVSGCPLLESLELSGIIGFHNVVIASKSLERLIFVDVRIEHSDEHVEISCPNLVELSIKFSGSPHIKWFEFNWSEFPVEVIENVLSRSPLLRTLELSDYRCSDRLLIASKSLKRLFLVKIYGASEFEISCPNLEELNLYHFVVDVFYSFKDFESESRWERCLALKILEQLQHVKRFEIGSWFLEILSALEMEAPFPLLNCKCLTLDGTKFDEHLLEIVYAIQNSPELENLVIKLQLGQSNKQLVNIWDLDCWRKKKYRNSNETIFKCSVSNLKTVKIVGLSEMDESPYRCLFNFVEFLLKNARMLEKISIILAKNCGTGFLFEVSKKLISFQRCFPHTTIELLRSNF